MDCGMICAHAVSKRFGDTLAVDGAELCVAPGEFVALLGPSGCGKTTLLRLLAGLEVPDGGEIRLHDRLVSGRDTWVPPERRGVGIVFQDYALFPHLTVAENIGFGVRRAGRARRIGDVIRLVGLDRLDGRYPHELSGGQQQRAALARALAPEPSIVLLDEPWSNIDPLLRQSMREELADILHRAEVTVLLVTHDREEAFSLTDRIALMLEGRILQAGTAEEIYLHPADRWTAEFAGPGNFLPGRVTGDLVETLLGRFPVANRNGATAVEVLLRPEQVEPKPDPAGDAEVIGREFRGHDVLYRLRLADGTILVSQRPSTERVELGARVAIRVHQADVTVFS